MLNCIVIVKTPHIYELSDICYPSCKACGLDWDDPVHICETCKRGFASDKLREIHCSLCHGRGESCDRLSPRPTSASR